MKVKNVKVIETPFGSTSKRYAECVKYLSSVEKDYKKFLPHKPKETLTFEIRDSNVDFANTIRRYILDEVPVMSLDVSESDIVSDDKFILTDHLKKNIEAVPLLQTIDEKEDLLFELDVTNTTDEIMRIYSSDMTINQKSSQKYFTQTIPLITLRPRKHLKISNIKTCSGVGKDDIGKFSSVSNIKYKIMDVKPLNKTRFNTEGVSSMVSTPTHFKISLTNHRNSPTKKIIQTAIKKIIEDVKIAQQEFSNIKKQDITYFSEALELETQGAINIYHLKGHYWTMANLLSKYCYLEDESIPFVCSSIIHPSREESLLKIKHTEHNKILLNATKKIINEYESALKAF